MRIFLRTVLDPRVKTSLFTNNPDLFVESWLKGCFKSFEASLLSTRYNQGADAIASDSELSVSAPAPKTSTRDRDRTAAALAKVLGDSDDNEDEQVTPKKKLTAKEELIEYLGEERLAKRHCPLEYWKKKQTRYPSLAAMARDFLAIPGSSVSVERIFNIGRDVISLRRASLSPDTIALLMNLRARFILEKRHPNLCIK